jgi:hypothetical protein
MSSWDVQQKKTLKNYYTTQKKSMASVDFWVLLTVPTPIGKTAQKDGKEATMARKQNRALCWGRWQTITFFWHASYGYCGTLNDVSILSLSPFLDKMVNSELHVIEKDSGVVPFRTSV